MNDLARSLIVIGAVILLVGVALLFGSRVGLGRLPGDLSWKRGNFQFYFPLATSLLLSVVLSLLFWLFRK